jgi:hypothetical protein
MVVKFKMHFDESSRQSHFTFLEFQETKENGHESSSQLHQHTVQPSSQTNGGEIEHKKVPLKLLMDPRHVQDLNSSMLQYGYEPSPMSPEFGYELVNALNAPQGKGEKTSNRRCVRTFIMKFFQELNFSPSAGRRLKSGSSKDQRIRQS